MKKIDLTTNLFGLEIYSRDKDSLLEILTSHLKERKKLISVFTPNPEQVVLSKRDKSFAKYLGFADILIPDGIGLLFASKLLSFFGKSRKNSAISERITGIDLSKELLKIAKKDKLKVLIIGGRDYEGREYDDWKVRKHFQEKFGVDGRETKSSEKQIIWWMEGYDKVGNPTSGEDKAIVSTTSSLKPDVIFVALGAPHQEKWVVENKDFLKDSGISLAIVVGGTFDVLLGKIGRAPRWVQNLGLEWLYRLVEEPWRWRRQMKLVEFVGLVVREVFN